MRLIFTAIVLLFFPEFAFAQATTEAAAKQGTDRAKLIEEHLPKAPPPLEGVANLTVKQLLAIAAKPNVDRLDLPQLRLFPRPGTYKVFITHHPVEGEKSEPPPHDVTAKLVDGRYIVSAAKPKADLPASSVIVTYDTASRCYRKWMLFGDRVIHESVGVMGEGATTIAWWTRMTNPAGRLVTVLSQDTFSKDAIAWTGRIFDENRFAGREIGRAVRADD